MSSTHRFIKFCRTVHLYLGVFTAPALLFFAITGGLQTFSLHETTRGSSYTPPAWLATAALLHKKQTIMAPPKRPRPVEPTAAPAAPAADVSESSNKTRNAQETTAASDRTKGDRLGPADRANDTPRKNLLPMKIFFAFVALALALSTLSGIYMAYRFSRKPRLVSGILAAGVLVPIVLLLL